MHWHVNCTVLLRMIYLTYDVSVYTLFTDNFPWKTYWLYHTWNANYVTNLKYFCIAKIFKMKIWNENFCIAKKFCMVMYKNIKVCSTKPDIYLIYQSHVTVMCTVWSCPSLDLQNAELELRFQLVEWVLSLNVVG